MRVVTSVAQPITVTVARADDRRSPVKTLFRGVVTDSVPITWDGTLGAGRAPGPAVGRYRLVVTSDSGPSPLEVEVPLEVSRATVDSLLDPAPPPAASGDSAAEVPIPMPRASGPPLGSLAVGLAAGAAAVALPAIVAPGARVTGARFVVGAALGVSAVVALFASRPHAAPPVEVAQAGDTSEGLRAEWQRQVDSVRALNARRRAEAPLVIHALPPVVLGSRGTTSP